MNNDSNQTNIADSSHADKIQWTTSLVKTKKHKGQFTWTNLNQIHSRWHYSRFWGAKQQNVIHTKPHTRPAQYICIKSIMPCSGCQQSHLVTKCGLEFPEPCLYLCFPLCTFIVTSAVYPPTCLSKPSSILSLLSSVVAPNLLFYTTRTVNTVKRRLAKFIYLEK